MLNRLRVHKERLLASALVLVFISVFISQASGIALSKSNTWDETAHILSGYAYLKEGMDYLSPLNHPVFGRMVTAALPAALLDIDFDKSVKPEEMKDSNFFPYSVRFLYENRTAARTFLFLSRLGNVILGAILGVYVFVWSKELWGVPGGYLSLFFYALSPNILANASLATTDMPATAFFFISAFYLYRISAHGITASRIISAAIALTLAFTSKHTAFLLIPVTAVCLAVNLKKEPARKVVLHYLSMALMVYVLIWAIYGFRYQSSFPHEPLLWDKFSASESAPLFNILRKIHLLPEAYLYSIAGVISGTGAGKAAFLMGRYSKDGWWYYFPVAFLVKTPVATIILLTAAFLFSSQEKEERRKAIFLIFPALLIFTSMSLQKVNIGIRHILPAYPFLFTLIGFVPLIKTEARGLAKAVFYICCIWYVYASVSIFPHQLAYFNEFIGGPKNGYKYLVDSNLDWGQDLPGLKRYMDEKKIETIKLAYFGLSDPRYFGIDYEYLPSYAIIDPQNVKEAVQLKGWFAISATMLQGVYLADKDYYRVFRERKPVDCIGYSIFIYKF